MEGHYGKWKGVTRAHCLMGRSLLWLWNHSWFLKSDIFKASLFVLGFSTAQLYHIHTIPPLESRGSCECWSLSATRTIHKHCKVMLMKNLLQLVLAVFPLMYISFTLHYTEKQKKNKTTPTKQKTDSGGWDIPEQQQLQVQQRRTGARPPKTANSCRKSRGKNTVNSH